MVRTFRPALYGFSQFGMTIPLALTFSHIMYWVHQENAFRIFDIKQYGFAIIKLNVFLLRSLYTSDFSLNCQGVQHRMVLVVNFFIFLNNFFGFFVVAIFDGGDTWPTLTANNI